jgi:hypothetical protein
MESNIEEVGRTGANQPIAGLGTQADLPGLEGSPYSAIVGGAMGGTPPEGRSSGDNVGHGISPGGVHRVDRTIGVDAETPREG